ncbi:FG-GAP-like repeat-containing protein [Pseudactinotalea terrae]|uniref:FG-GAP-like repeat-containing protein n=1 Tax=Pseudactinotalea terrae TaxID=1743262 RepID=UPI0012E0CE2B|nr:FG-GAP-like repeat-containing protein [Pseudactinotalea terrae]
MVDDPDADHPSDADHRSNRVERRRSSVLALAAVALVTLGLSVAPAAPAHAVTESTATARIYADTNTHRSSNGRTLLVRNAQLDAVAASWSDVQCSRGEMGHNPRLAQQIPPGWSAAAENVARGYSYDRVVAAWIGSPGHNANLLGNYTHVGIGYCELNGDRYYTQVFARYPGSLPGDGTASGSSVLAISPDGVLYRYPGNGAGLFGTRQQIGVGWGGMSLVTGVGDITGDGNGDVVARDSMGRLVLYAGTATGGLVRGAVMGPGWGQMNLLLGVGDFTGDGRADLLARDTVGRLWLYAGRGSGQLAGGVQIGVGWGVMTAVAAPGDVNSDGRPDVVARDAGGRLWLYPGRGNGRFQGSQQVGHGWQIFDAIVAPGDFSGDGLPDLLARTASGALLLYTSTSSGSWRSGPQVGSGWTGFRVVGPGAD